MNKFRLTWDPFRQPTAVEASAYLPTPNNPEIQWEAMLESIKEAALKKRAGGQLEDVHICHTIAMLWLMHSQDKEEIKAGTSKYTITIHQTANEQLIGTLKLLLDANAPVDERDEKGLTALHYAAFVGNAKIVKALLQAKATVDVEHEKVGTPLSIAVMQRHPEVCRLLLLAGAKPLSGRLSSVSLFDRVVYGDLAAVKLLLDSGADPNSIEDIAHIKGVTPLHMAAEMGHLEIAELLTQRGAKLDARTSTDSQHIHQAAMNGHDKMVALLLELGADVNCRDDNGVTPLDFAIFRENYQTADMIREVGGKHNKLKIKKDPETRERAERSIADDISAKQDNAIVLVRVATASATR
jgi:ankyrin repeat protein